MKNQSLYRLLALLLMMGVLLGLAACGSKPSAAGSSQEETDAAVEEPVAGTTFDVTKAPFTLFDQGGITVEVTGLGESLNSQTVLLKCTNATEQDVQINVLEMVVNGIYVDGTYCRAEVPAGETVDDESIYLNANRLLNQKIETIATVELTVQVKDADGRELLDESDRLLLEFADKDFVQPEFETDALIYDEYGVKIYAVYGMQKDGYGYDAVTVWIENDTDSVLRVWPETMTVNGTEYHSSVTTEVMAHTHTAHPIAVNLKNFDLSDPSEVTSVTLSLHLLGDALPDHVVITESVEMIAE